ncbi:ARM repeat-containing protein [Ramicandelaber brevisporus]|nr:ARM repeat-containing protein [Ramicandelaber brevisporus]
MSQRRRQAVRISDDEDDDAPQQRTQQRTQPTQRASRAQSRRQIAVEEDDEEEVEADEVEEEEEYEEEEEEHIPRNRRGGRSGGRGESTAKAKGKGKGKAPNNNSSGSKRDSVVNEDADVAGMDDADDVGDDGDDEEIDPQQAMNCDALAAQIVRLALASERRRVPLRRDDMVKRLSIGHHKPLPKDIKVAMTLAEKMLRDIFGMDLVELPAHYRTANPNTEAGRRQIEAEKAEYTQRLQATQAQNEDEQASQHTQGGRGGSSGIGGASKNAKVAKGKDASTKQWMLYNVLQADVRTAAPVTYPPADSTLAGVTGAVLALLFMNGCMAPAEELYGHMRELGIAQIPHSQFNNAESLLALLVKQGYLDKTVKVTAQQSSMSVATRGGGGGRRGAAAGGGSGGGGGGDDEHSGIYEYRWGPRAKTEYTFEGMVTTLGQIMDMEVDEKFRKSMLIASEWDMTESEMNKLFKKVKAIQSLDLIALALGPQRTRTELLDFLDESVEDEDEVLAAIATKLGDMINFVGGQEYVHKLLKPLENLAAVEEVAVRDKAVESINRVCAELSASQIEEYYVPMVKRLATGSWFSNRASSAALFAACYKQVSPSTRDNLHQLIESLTRDETPMARRSIATHLPNIINKMEVEAMTTTAVSLFNQLASDDQDSVRLFSIDSLIAISKRLDSPATSVELLSQSLNNLCTDKSWRVRFMAASKFVDAAQTMNTPQMINNLSEIFIGLMTDTEAEVRSSICTQIPGYCSMVDRDIILNKFLPILKELSKDDSEGVRAKFATHISGLAPLLDKDATIEHLQPMFLQLLKDENSDVRLNVISQLEQVNGVIGIDLLSQSLLPAIVDLANDKQWRVREAIIKHLPLLANQLGREFFDQALNSMCIKWLTDNVCAVRDIATSNLSKLTTIFGIEWTKHNLLPHIIEQSSNQNYLYRITSVFAATTIGLSIEPEVVKEHILPILGNLINDPIPNIRFNIAKSIEQLSPLLMSKPETAEYLTGEVANALQKLTTDEDIDVKYYATHCLETIHNLAANNNSAMNSSPMPIEPEAAPATATSATPATAAEETINHVEPMNETD